MSDVDGHVRDRLDGQESTPQAEYTRTSLQFCPGGGTASETAGGLSPLQHNCIRLRRDRSPPIRVMAAAYRRR